MSLSPEQVEEFEREGVLIAPDVLTDDDFAPVIAELEEWIDRRARELHEAGKIDDLHVDEPFESRIAYLIPQCAEVTNGIDIMHRRGPAIFDFLHNENLLDAVESLIGPEITCSPIQHLRAKVCNPDAETSYGNFSDVPWHQDAGVTWDEADVSTILTCWIPLMDATRENGCMEVIPGVGRQYLEHQAEGGTTIRPDQMPDREPICAECPKGGVVFMHQFTPHRGLPNRVPGNARWTIDLRYQQTGTPTGRPFQPAFPVRSADPSNVPHDYEKWCEDWEHALANPTGEAAHRPARRRQLAEGGE